jgi:hypothetical protein
VRVTITFFLQLEEQLPLESPRRNRKKSRCSICKKFGLFQRGRCSHGGDGNLDRVRSRNAEAGYAFPRVDIDVEAVEWFFRHTKIRVMRWWFLSVRPSQ